MAPSHSSVRTSDMERLEKLTHSKRTEPRLSHSFCHHVNTNKASHLLTWVVAPLSVIYSLKPHILTHLKSPTRPDGGNLSLLGPQIRDTIIQECFELCLWVNSKHFSALFFFLRRRVIIWTPPPQR